MQVSVSRRCVPRSGWFTFARRCGSRTPRHRGSAAVVLLDSVVSDRGDARSVAGAAVPAFGAVRAFGPIPDGARVTENALSPAQWAADRIPLTSAGVPLIRFG